MKTVIFLIFMLFVLSNSGLSAQKIVDGNFAKAIRNQCEACIDKNNRLTKSADTLKVLDISSNKIKTLNGFNFSALWYFNCANNQLTTLPKTLPVKLEGLNCSNNQLTALPKTLPIELVDLECSDNQLMALPKTLPNELKYLDCKANPIKYLPTILPKTLEFLNTENTEITCIPHVLPNVSEGDYPTTICGKLRLREVNK